MLLPVFPGLMRCRSNQVVEVEGTAVEGLVVAIHELPQVGTEFKAVAALHPSQIGIYIIVVFIRQIWSPLSRPPNP